MFAQVYVAALTLVFSRSAFAFECSRNYTIMEGDICDSISQRQNVSTSQFAQVNRNLTVEDCNNLPPGKTICLGYVDHDCWDTQTVQPGDTCKKIAEENGVSEDTLCANNEQVGNECKIYGGEVLCVANKVIGSPGGAPPPPSTDTPSPTKDTPTPSTNATPPPSTNGSPPPSTNGSPPPSTSTTPPSTTSNPVTPSSHGPTISFPNVNQSLLVSTVSFTNAPAKKIVIIPTLSSSSSSNTSSRSSPAVTVITSPTPPSTDAPGTYTPTYRKRSPL